VTVRASADLLTESPAPSAVAARVAALRSRFGGLDGLFSMFSALMSAQMVTAVLGLAYWALAAHLLDTDEVGLAVSAVAGMTLLSTFGMLGMTSVLVRDLRVCHPADRRTRLRAGLVVTALGGGTLGLLWALAAPALGDNFRATGGSLGVALLFTIGSATQTVCDSFDYAVLGLRRGDVQLSRNAIASTLKLAFLVALPVLGFETGVALLATWVLGLAVSIPLGYKFTRRSLANPLAVPTVRARSWVRSVLPEAVRHHCLTLSLVASGLLLPIIVAMTVSATEVAYFSTARFIFTALLAVPFMLCASLFATVSAHPERLAECLRRTVPVGLGINLVICVVMLPFAGLILSIFGGEYGAQGATALRLLVLAGLPLVIKDHFVVIRRTQGRMLSAVWVIVIATIAEMAAAVIGGHLWGLNGLCAAWLVVLVLEALYVAPVLRESMAATNPTPVAAVVERAA
jgi:O-antigen/teichoic acid export membrane protein